VEAFLIVRLRLNERRQYFDRILEVLHKFLRLLETDHVQAKTIALSLLPEFPHLSLHDSGKGDKTPKLSPSTVNMTALSPVKLMLPIE
jgi:hypothetical protein